MSNELDKIPKTKKIIYVVGEINESTTSEVLRELVETEWDDDNITTLDMYIVSEGGYLRDCFAIIDIVTAMKKEHNLKIKTYGLGEISSSGFFLFLLGDERFMFERCRVFVHEHITLNDERTYNERIKADRTEEKEVYESYVKFTAERLNISVASAKNLLKKNKLLNAKDITSYNIVTSIKED